MIAGAVHFILGSCVAFPERATRDARILAMGDSILAWNRGSGQSIPDVVEDVVGREVVNASVPGARLREDGARAAFGLSIPRQYVARDWDAVIVNGGANDLRSRCGCRQCSAELDRLITRDGRSGAYPRLLNQISAQRIVLVGYYGPVIGGGGAFDGCDDELQELGRRLSRLAASDASIRFVPVRDLIGGVRANYDSDLVHPSPSGSVRIGRRVAEELAR